VAHPAEVNRKTACLDSSREHLLSTEVLCGRGSLSSSQGRVRPRTLGRGLGGRLRDGRELGVSRRGNKKAHCWPFLKPSDGLEPSTPSLPYPCARN
jgi:hypothetical protein